MRRITALGLIVLAGCTRNPLLTETPLQRLQAKYAECIDHNHSEKICEIERKELEQQRKLVVDVWRDHFCGDKWISFQAAMGKRFATYGQGQHRESEAELEVERTGGPFGECMKAAYAAHGVRTDDDYPKYFFGGQAERDAGLMK